AALEQVRRERVAQEVGMHALRLEPGLRRQPPQDQEGAGARQPAALRVEEELRAVARVEERPAAREVPPQCLHGLAPNRHDAFLGALPEAAYEPPLQVDARLDRKRG